MTLFEDLFGVAPCPSHLRPEVDKLIDELLSIGKSDDFLSERPGAGFNSQCRHVRAIGIGRRLDEIGGLALMEFAYRRVKRKLGKNHAWHLEYAWKDVGHWNY